MEHLLRLVLLQAALDEASARLVLRPSDMSQSLEDSVTMVRHAFPEPLCLRVLTQGARAPELVPAVFRAGAVVMSPAGVRCSGTVVLADSGQEVVQAVATLSLSTADRVLVLLRMGKPRAEAPLPVLPLELFRGALVEVGVSGRLYRLGQRGLELLPPLSSVFPPPSYRLPDLQGRRLRISTFHCPPFSYGVARSRNSTNARFGGELDGIEMGIFLLLSQRLNFSWEMREPTEEHKWGKLLENGSWSGGITGALATGQVDVAFCYLWVSIIGYKFFDLTCPWTSICNTMLVPRPRKVIVWKAVFSPLEGPVWAGVLLAAAVTAMALYLLARRDSIHTSQFHQLESSALTTVGMLVLTSYPPSHHSLTHSKPVLCSWLWFCLLVTTAYSSKLVAHLTVPIFSRPLDSAEDLVNAGLYWEETYFPYVEMIFNSENPWHQLFIKRFHLMPAEQKSVLDESHVVPGLRIQGVHEYVQPNHELNKESLFQLRVMKECFSQYYITLGLPKRSPLTDPFNRAISRMKETGVVAYLQQDVVRRRGDPVLIQRLLDLDHYERKQDEPEPLTLSNLVGVFYLWAVGVSTATFAFVMERIHHHHHHHHQQQQQHNHYQRYNRHH